MLNYKEHANLGGPVAEEVDHAEFMHRHLLESITGLEPEAQVGKTGAYLNVIQDGIGYARILVFLGTGTFGGLKCIPRAKLLNKILALKCTREPFKCRT